MGTILVLYKLARIKSLWKRGSLSYARQEDNLSSERFPPKGEININE